MTPEFRDRRRAMFAAFAAVADAEASRVFLTAHPILLTPDLWADARDWAASLDPDMASGLEGPLRLLERFAGEVQRNPRAWPEGGPVEDLADQVARGLLTPAQGLEAAAEPSFAERLGPLYAEVCAFRSEGLALGGDIFGAVRRFQILFAGLDAIHDSGWAEALARVVGTWIGAATVACRALPDGAWLTDAAARGEAVLAPGAPPLPPSVQGALWQRLGVLHLDPYVAGRRSSEIEAEQAAWRGRLVSEYGVAEAGDPVHAMPTFRTAMEQAVTYLRRALPFQQGEARGETLKALAEAIVWRRVAGGLADPEAARAAAQEALALLPGGRHQQARAVLDRLLEQLDGEARVDTGEDWNAFFARSPAEVADGLGASLALERYDWAFKTLRPPRPDTLELAGEVWRVLGEAGDETGKVNLARAVLDVLTELATGDGVLPVAVSELADRAAALLAAGRLGDPAVLAGRLMALAFASMDGDQEALGLPIAGAAMGVAGEEAWAPLLRILQARLHRRAGANAYNQRAFAEAVARYAEVLALCAELDLGEMAVKGLDDLDEAAFDGGDDAFEAFVQAFARVAPRLDRADRPGLQDRVHLLWRKAFGRAFAGGRVDPTVLARLMQAAKGAAFALTALDARTADWRGDSTAVALLREIAPLRAAAPDRGAPDPQLTDDDVLCAFASRVATSAAGPAGAAARLEERFDDRLRRTAVAVGDPLAIVSELAALQASLGPRTVFLTHYLGTAETGQSALFSLIVTAEAVFAAGGAFEFPGSIVEMTGVNRAIRLQPQGVLVSRLRTMVARDPGPALVDSDADDELLDDLQLLGGGLSPHLTALREAGKNHLCIHPHGAYHFHPLHLIGGSRGCLADDWTVTTVPHPVLLRRRSERTARRLAAFSLSFKDRAPHGLDPLSGTTDEAAEIAEIMGGRHWADAEATEGRVLEALESATHLHIATHGMQQVGAPAFQKVFLSPDGETDGLLNAYEVLGRDLRHIQLVTLSACQTALGRFDAGDTLRGLTANLLAGGVAAIVSTLWFVGDAVSKAFFVALYRKIAADQPPLEAFRAAQVATRKDFPAFVDWGAFQYSGTW